MQDFNDFLILLTAVIWVLLCVAIFMYLNLDRLRTHTQMLWKNYKSELEELIGHPFSTRRFDAQLNELLTCDKMASASRPLWWAEFVFYYNASAEKYNSRLGAPLFRQLAALLRLRKIPLL